MGVGAGLYMYDVVVKNFTFTISSPNKFLFAFSITSFSCDPQLLISELDFPASQV